MTMKKTLLVLIAVFAGLFNLSLQAQCPNNNTLFFTYPAPTTIGASVGTGICIFAGEHYVITNMQAGSTYRLSSCGSPDLVDTRITVYPNASGGSARPLAETIHLQACQAGRQGGLLLIPSY